MPATPLIIRLWERLCHEPARRRPDRAARRPRRARGQPHPRHGPLRQPRAPPAGLRFCGVEVVRADPNDLGASPIVRLDANPELHELAAAGPERRALVVQIYRRLLASSEALLADGMPRGPTP